MKKCTDENCILRNEKQYLIFTNCQNNLDEIEYVFICDYITDDIIKNMKKIFNEKDLYDKIIKQTKYAFISVIPCINENIVFNDKCTICQKILDKLNKNNIIALGPKALQLLGIKKLNKIDAIDINDKKIFPMIDTIYFNNRIDRGLQKLAVSKFKDFIHLKNEIQLTNDKMDFFNKNQKNIYFYKIPSKFLKEEFKLEDVQYNYKEQYLLMILRNGKNERVDHIIPLPEENYYWYEGLNSNKWTEKIENLIFKRGAYSQRNLENNCYESDMKIQDKFSCDYYLQKEKEINNLEKNVLYFDIEIDIDESLKFPKPELAERAINAISFKFNHNKSQIYLLKTPNIDKRYKEIIKEYDNLTFFTNEVLMIKAFWKKVHQYNPTFIAGWNSNNFDNLYFYYRLKKLGVNPNNVMSKYKYISLNDKYFNETSNFGYISIDLMNVYKDLTYTNEPSYALDYICNKELGESKVKYEGDLNFIFRNDLKTFIEYSLTDTELLYKLNEKLLLIDQIDELKRTCGVTFSSVMSTIGQADGLFYQHLKNNNETFIVAKHAKKEWIKGGYVRDPKGGLYDWIVDLDYTSLYPSITNSCNIGPNTYIAKIDQSFSREFIYNRNNISLDQIDIIKNPIFNNRTEKISLKDFEEFLKQNNAIVTSNGTIFKGHDKELSIFYEIIAKLFKQRKEYKKLMNKAKAEKDESNRRVYYSKQMAYKILLNSLYGILANEHFRFYNTDLASTITCTGRELIRFAGEHIDTYMKNDDENIKINPNFFNDVLEDKDYLLYCDTDSLFLWMENYLKNKNIPVTIDNIESNINRIQKFLNEKLLSIFCKLHNIDLKRSMFEMKNELIAKRYYTLSCKKHYALHVIKSEGVDVDFIDIKGLDVIRSDIPEFSQQMLEKIIDYLLKEQEIDIDYLYEILSEYKEKAMNLIIDKEIKVYKTVSFSKPLKEYKNMPQHIKGMLMFNELEYEHFTTGHRGILVPLKGLDFNLATQKIKDNYNKKFKKKYTLDDLNCIVLPESYRKVPEYYVIDVKKVLDFSIDERFNLLLEPLIVKNDSLLMF